MTGTGKQNDPYVVDNWTDYQKIYGKSVYIEWDNNFKNKVIDFDKIQPNGFTTQIKFSRYTKFNGWKFTNLYIIHQSPLSFGDAGGVLDGFILENFYWIMPETILECTLLTFEQLYSSISTMKNCVISGKIESQGECRLTNAHICESSANIGVNSAKFTLTNRNVRNSDIILDATGQSVNLTSENILNSRISGKITAENPIICGNSASGYNVFDVVSNQPAEYVGRGIMVYNSDKMTASGTGHHIACTTEQIINPEHLNSIRFPIGVD
ncbi:MAG: hypothetical protein K2G36_08310 [Ruminococcus sp.]|nr:hypothetical protein [Ruminococcus sp.]